VTVGNNNATTYAPYWLPIAERSDKLGCAARVTKPVPGGGDRDLASDDCPDNTLTGANIRLRIEPTINVAERISIRTQIDIFDNHVMGSTPDSLTGGGLTALSEGQATPIAGLNSSRPAVLIKRVWAEWDTGFGLLKVGRMPWHWGLGLMANDGECWDCNHGDNVDRISYTGEWFQHRFGVSYDFAGSGPNSSWVDLDANATGFQPMNGGQAVDLEQLDDADQVVLFVGRIDRPQVLRDRLEQGELVLNYGGLFVWRKQDFDYLINTDNPGIGVGEAALGRNLREISAWTVTPDLWVKLMWRRLHVEVEGLATLGEIGNVSNEVDGEQVVDIFQFGLVARAQYDFLRRRALKVGFEFGLASGDENELYDLNRRRRAQQLDGVHNLGELQFDPDFHVDLILFREIMGSVANAMYFKPWIQYDFLDTIGARLDVIYSMAHRSVAYPGNNVNLGLEFDLDLFYKSHDGRVMAGLQYGLLIPFAGLDRPAELYGDQRTTEVAQTLQTRLVFKF
ncbi:MAG: TIGR04551 family protein, partial [Deltaproteobacteria bacterium]|nr:TIGR04551 family protein [Deltaproteobacteria bacterium]